MYYHFLANEIRNIEDGLEPILFFYLKYDIINKKVWQYVRNRKYGYQG